MPISRRQLLQFLGTAGVSFGCGENSWLLAGLETYGSDRLGYSDLRGPGLTSFSRSVCRDCPNHCSLAVRKVDEFPVGLRGTPWHPASLGALCVAGQSQMQALFDPDRLSKPLLRQDAGAPGRMAEWSEALDLLATRVGALVASGEGKRIAVVDGRTPSLGTRLLEAWVQSVPGATYLPLRIEGVIDRMAQEFLGGAAGGRLRFDLAHTGTLLLVGSELLELDGSPVTQMRSHGDRREDPLLDHAPTLYLGPRQSATAVQGDHWIPCQPGRESDILLSFAEALSRDHPDRGTILRQYARWIPEARDPVGFARRYSLESVARAQGLKAEELKAVVRALREFGPAVTLPGPSVLRRPQGFVTASAALALNLWTDGFRESGGLSWGGDPLSAAADQLGLGARAEHDPGALLGILQPLLDIKRSPVDVLVCVEADLVHELPGRDQIARALSHVPFLACLSTCENETSRLAHVTLPTLLDLESWDLPAAGWGVPEPSLQVQRPAVMPVVEARSVEDVVLHLASAGAAGAGFAPRGKSGRELVEAAIGGIVARRQGELVAARGRRPLASVGERAAIASLLSGEAVWVAGSEPGPRAARAAATPTASLGPGPDLAPDQLWLVPFDSAAIQSGRILNRPMMLEISGMPHGLAWEPWVEVHPNDARRRGIRSGDWVKIRGQRAEIACRAIVTRTVTPRVVAVPVGFGHEALGRAAAGTGVSPLSLPNAVLDAQTGVPAWGPVPVFIERA
jgi:molybdopterin-containing oxidoreductase family iron-sulfur binding subunit